MISKAQYSADQQAAVNTWKELYAIDLADGKLDGYEGDSTVPGNAIATKYNSGYTATNGKVKFTYTGEKSGTTFTWTENDTTDGAGAWS